MTLKRKMAHAALWSLADNIGSQGVSFVVFMFVARLIGPEQYGLANVCFVFLVLANIVISGMADGIISLQIRDDLRLSTLFWCVLGAGFGLTLICIAGAGQVAEIMGAPAIRPLLQWFSVVFIFLAASVVPTKLLISEMNFKIIAFRTFVTSLTSGVIGIVMAYKGYGAYALAAQQIALFLGVNLVAWHYIDWRPAFVFDTSMLLSSLSPGFKIVGADMFAVVEEQMPRLLVGGILGATVLGYYAFVMRLCLAINDILCHPPISVLYPSITKIRENLEEQANILGRVIAGIGFFIFPIFALSAYTAPIYIPLFFGDAWKPAVPILQVIISGSAALPILLTIREVLRAHNKIGAYLKVKIPLAAINLLIVIGLVSYGIIPVSIGITSWTLCTVPFYLYLFKNCIGISLWKSLIMLSKSLASIIMMIIALLLYEKSAGYPTDAWLRLLSSLAIGGSVYLIVSLVTQHSQLIQIMKLMKQLRADKRSLGSASS